MDYKEETKKCYNNFSNSFIDKFTGYAQKLNYLEEPMKRFLSLIKSGGKILDLGCGTGNYSLIFQSKGYQVTAIDISEEMIRISKERGVKDARIMDFENLCFEQQYFDGILAYACLMHVPKSKLDNIFEQIKKVLKNDGVVYVAMKKGNGEGFRVQEKYLGAKRWFSLFNDKELREHINKYFNINSFDEIIVDGNTFLHYLLTPKNT